MPMPQSAAWIMLTSFPPSPVNTEERLSMPFEQLTPPGSAGSPMAQVLLAVCCCSSVTIWAFCVGEQRQQTTAGHWQANSTNSCS